MSSDQTLKIVIIGAGVLGLSTANVLQTKYPGADITLVASEFPTPSPMLQSEASSTSPNPSPSYASMWAGAHYRPIPFIPKSHQAFETLLSPAREFHLQLARERNWALVTAERMKVLAHSNPEAGVGIVQAEEYLESPPIENLILRSGCVYASSDDCFQVFGPTEIDAVNARICGDAPAGEGDDAGKSKDGDLNGSVKWACSYESYVVNVHVYCAYLLQQFIERGGRTIRRRLGSFEDAIDALSTSSSHSSGLDSKNVPIIVNCSGTGLCKDPDINIIRGQTVLVRNAYPKTTTRQCSDGTWSFLIPRPGGGGTIVGGTKQVGDENGSPRPEERKMLLENAVKYFSDFVDRVHAFEVVCDNVGRRPARRGGVRVEREEIKIDAGRLIEVIHGYGAGGRGYELSWGIAEELGSLVDGCLIEGGLMAGQ